ncbi:MAG: efflux RND transporter periplasmic adaptor subunit [Prevotellaceae bacterium]|nr:efflux RND transporter periplasmic adaptor subunit [Prevotellaceae bacterium]
MKKNHFLLGSLFVCMLLSCGGQKDEKSEASSYRLSEIRPSDVTLTSRHSASIRGRQDIDVRPQISGLVTKVCVTEGEHVRKGQTLFVIDQEEARSALDLAHADVNAAKAELATAQLDAEGKRELFKAKTISEHDLKTAENNLAYHKALLAQAQAREKKAEKDLSFTVITSPSDGTIGTLPYKIGALVSPDMKEPLTTVSENHEMYVYFSLTERQMLDLLDKNKSGKSVIQNMPTLTLELSNGTVYGEKGRVESISGIVDRSTRTVSVRAAFPNTDGLLLSGSTGNILIPEVRKNVFVVPQMATFEMQDKVFAYKVVNGKAASVEVKVSQAGDGKNYIVEQGLAKGDVIVAEGVATMREGTLVNNGHQ